MLCGWENTYGDQPRVVVELALQYIFRKQKSKLAGEIPKQDYTLHELVGYINWYSINKRGYCKNEVCNYILNSPWKGMVTNPEYLALYTDPPPRKGDEALGCATPPGCGLPTMEQIASRLVLDEHPSAKVTVYTDDIAITVDEAPRDSSSVVDAADD